MKRTLGWWTYIIVAIYVSFFLAPTLISFSDTMVVLVGFLLYIGLGLWSWHWWVKPLISYIKRG